MFKGVIFLLKYFWKHEKRYVIYQVLLQILTAAVPLMDIVIPRYIINELTGLQRAEVVFGWIALLIFGNLAGHWLIDYFRGNSFVMKGKVFTEFQTMMADKLSRSDFVRLEDPHFLDMKGKAEKFLYGNGMGFGTVLDSAFTIAGKLFTSSSRFCDHIALFQNGEIVEYGTHEQLMQAGTVYKELFKMQAQYYV